MSISDDLDRTTQTFSADRRFCDHLLGSAQASAFAEMFVFYSWARCFLPHFQMGFQKLVPMRFDRDCHDIAKVRTFALLTGITKDLQLVPYFVVRGVISEAGSVLRRALE